MTMKLLVSLLALLLLAPPALAHGPRSARNSVFDTYSSQGVASNSTAIGIINPSNSGFIISVVGISGHNEGTNIGTSCWQGAGTPESDGLTNTPSIDASNFFLDRNGGNTDTLYGIVRSLTYQTTITSANASIGRTIYRLGYTAESYDYNFPETPVYIAAGEYLFCTANSSLATFAQVLNEPLSVNFRFELHKAR